MGKSCVTTLSWNTVRSLLKFSFAFVCLILIDDIVFIVFKNDLGASAVPHRAEA